NDFGIYANVSQFSFPDDFVRGDYASYHDGWPYSDFVVLDDPSSIFWNNFNFSFESEFERGFQDANDTYWSGFDYYNPNQWNMPEPNWYDDYEIDRFGSDTGKYFGYEVGWNAVWESDADNLWNDMTAALNGFYEGFFLAREDGFTAGEADFLANMIPDKRPDKPPVAVDVEEFGKWFSYPRFYEDYYSNGFLYQGSLVFFNDRLYKDFYDSIWNTYWNGYRDGYGDEYWQGQNHGYWDDFNSAGYKANYWPPDIYWDPYDAYDEGRQDGAYAGYDRGYDDGYFGQNIGEQRNNAYHDWIWPAYYDGFANATADALALIVANNVPDSLPFAAPSNEYESASNWMYSNQYAEGYDRGYTYALLVSSPETINWLWSNGPFYNMTLPDAEFALSTGSIIPFPILPTMLTEIDLDLMDYEFNWGAHDYWPFSSQMVSFMTFDSSDTDFTDLNTFDHPRNDTSGEPGFSTTWDIANNYFEFTMDQNASEPGVLIDITWGYNTSTNMLLNMSAYVNFYSQTDMWLDVVLELNEGKTEVISVALPSPTSWSYYVGDFVFYYDLPPATPSDFANGVDEFKQNARSSIGNTFLTVGMNSITGLWANATMTLQNPGNLTEPPSVGTHVWPLFSGGGPLLIEDWNYWDGVFITGTSIFGNVNYFTSALNALAGQNYNVDLTEFTFIPEFGEYYYPTTGIQYYYVTLEADVDFGWSMLNGDFEWETITETGWVNATFYVGVDYATGVVLGAGARASFDFIMTQDPDYGMNGGGMSAYLEMQIGSTFKAMPNLFDLIGDQFPEVPEYGLISILSIIGLAAMASAVIFFKRKY
ncbi:MAG: hypothetical protein KAS63_02095, partial [Candidatus Heimdallarchaeota archaeon]|nr:hypothetical protein [Candidatus Heimdallarchaeota archaeon]MCK4954127.1 hypothetical protein [Candidatus Heimdallarchaeota archaeon]